MLLTDRQLVLVTVLQQCSHFPTLSWVLNMFDSLLVSCRIIIIVSTKIIPQVFQSPLPERKPALQSPSLEWFFSAVPELRSTCKGPLVCLYEHDL